MEENTHHNLLNQNGTAYSTKDISSSPYSKKKQTIATACATLGCLLNGCVIGFTSPALPSLLTGSPDIYGNPVPLELQQSSWIASILSIGCFIGCIMAGPIMEKIGRKQTLLWVCTVNYALGFILILVANNTIFIYIGRFLNGVGLGLVLATVSVYIVEIATTDMRGILGCFVQFQGSIGVLMTFSLGYVLTWWQLAAAHLVLVLPFFIAMCCVPESPRWLILKGREWEGEVALKWLRGRNPESLDREIDQIKREIAIRKRERISTTMLLESEILKPFLVCLMMMFFLQMSGFNVIVYYCGIIFKDAGSTIHHNLASIIVGSVLLISCFVSLAVVSRLNRKTLLVTSILGMSVCHVGLGTYFHFYTNSPNYASDGKPFDAPGGNMDAPDLPPLGWLPLVSVVGFLFLGNVGYGTLIWVVTAELLPPKVRSIANSIIICFAFVSGFIIAKTFVDLEQSIGYSGTFWFYAAVCFLGAIFTFIFVPETRDKSIEEIQNHFRSHRNRKSTTAFPLETVA
ncbi:facilitated trehalose transporter Tret1-2 homolog [Eurytemora carolleeae]|uniref:facilitated trehalose transporter Tret1-2 homolog n=1 Tax=Eurytemora carolleeae TaxID=1294199 RepID=UPI000C788AF9|nr:facilitated trehalose transporter Tret1-2 homolog [Eurytemora carolleeae]|eukprot:XP_023346118.1 facilitated trehalose transporter Tret1-2 homolog [Eurytemora affinis]